MDDQTYFFGPRRISRWTSIRSLRLFPLSTLFNISCTEQLADNILTSQIFMIATTTSSTNGAAETITLQRRRLARLYDLTRRAMAGEPTDDPTFAAFQRVAQRHRLPDRWPLDLIDGFAMDVDHRVYRTIDDVMA